MRSPPLNSIRPDDVYEYDSFTTAGSNVVAEISVEDQFLNAFSSKDKPGRDTPATYYPVERVSIVTDELSGNLTSCPFFPAISIIHS